MKYLYGSLCVSFLVLIGWLVSPEVLIALVPGHVTAKPATAILFVLLSAAAASFIHINPNIRLLGHIFLFLTLAGIYNLVFGRIHGTGIFYLDFLDSAEAPYTVSPGVPSVAALALFFFWILAFFIKHKPGWLYIKLVAGLTKIVCLIALIGHIFNIDALYFYYPEVSAGIGLPTIIAFWFFQIFMLKKGKEICSVQ